MNFMVWTSKKYNYLYKSRPRKGDREIFIGKPIDKAFPDNEIISSKYTIWSFLPKNLFEQFRRIANAYFLLMAIIAFIIESPVSPLTSLLPLLFVVAVTGIKQAYEDLLRHRADREINNLKFTVIRNQETMTVIAKDIKVGDIVKIEDENAFPCDLVLLVSSHKESKCFVTTANLDGETNLKTLFCPKTLKRNIEESKLGSLDAKIECESPSENLYKFNGRLEYGTKTSNLLRQSIILRENFIKTPTATSHCCYPECLNCDIKKRRNDGVLVGNEFEMINMRCDCQCRTRGVLPENFKQAIKAFENTTEHDSQGNHSNPIESGRRSSSLSTASGPIDGSISKMNSVPEMITTDGKKHVYDSLTKSALKKTHKKTESNVSRVSFNLDFERQDSRSSIRNRDWTLERKTTLLSRRKSSLLSSKRVSLSDGAIVDPLGSENLLLRGAKLRNTGHVYGCAVYTGEDTKLALNSKITTNKFSTVENSVNKFLYFYLAFMVVEVIISTVLKSLRESDIGFKSGPEKRFKTNVVKQAEKATAQSIAEDFFSFVVLYNYVIPISLYVTMEMQKFLGTLFFEWDLRMYDDRSEEAALTNTSDLNEDLGQIDYLFTDKTGTLTENNMQFKLCSVNGKTYTEYNGGIYETEGVQRKEKPPINLISCDENMEQFILSLVLCHTVQVEEKPTQANDDNSSTTDTDDDEPLTYSAASPDEKALVEAMQRLDIIFTNDEDDLIVVKFFGESKIFKRLEVLEFTSDRKRMSVIIEDEDQNLFLYCKGAESAIIPLVSNGPTDETLQHVADFATRGLRTLMVAFKKISPDDFEKISWNLRKARETLGPDRETVVAKAYKKVEAGLTVLGATGVEDKLQDKVQKTLESLRNAGIKVWILTGDKVETAVNISMACGHLKPGTIRLQLVGRKNADACAETLEEYRKQIVEGALYGLVVDGESLGFALEFHKELFREVCMACSAVICCRMSPLQKSEVVRLVKTSPCAPVTAAIGDGANDVAMIQEAHVGLGIMGKEGRQAVRCADFAFGRFKFLREALLVHGHWYYLRVATLVQYFFYKNIVFILPQFYFLFFNGYSTQPLYDSMYLTCFNIFFTSLPIIFYGLFEQNFTADQLRAHPGLYTIHKGNSLMTWRHFSKWFVQGIWHSLVIFFFPFLWYWGNSSVVPEGRDGYLETFGTLIYHCSIVVVNLKLWLYSRYWCLPFIASLVLSFAAWILLASVYAAVDLVETASTYWSFFHLVAAPNTWLISLLIAAACLIPDIILDTIGNQSLKIPDSKVPVVLTKLKSVQV